MRVAWNFHELKNALRYEGIDNQDPGIVRVEDFPLAVEGVEHRRWGRRIAIYLRLSDFDFPQFTVEDRKKLAAIREEHEQMKDETDYADRRDLDFLLSLLPTKLDKIPTTTK